MRPGASSPSLFPWAATGFLFFAHFVVDSQASFFGPLIPLLREKLGFSLAAAGLVVSLQSASGALSQPLTALVVDRWPWLPWLPVGLIGSSLAFTAVGWVPDFAGVAIAVPLGGILFGLCHPDMAARAGRLSQGGSSLIVSIFVTGGRLGFSLGPLIAIAIARTWGVEWLWTYVLVAAAATAGVIRGMPAPPRPERGEGGGWPGQGLWRALRRVRGPMALLFLVAVSRAVVLSNLAGFLPTLFVEEGLGIWRGGMANTVIYAGGAVGVMLGGVLGDRVGQRNVIAAGMALALAAMVGFLTVPLALAYFPLAAVGMGVFIPMGVSVALAQDLLPDHRGFGSSLTLGGGWFLASPTSVPIAWAAERVGLMGAFWALAVCLVLGVLCALCLPRSRPRRQGQG